MATETLEDARMRAAKLEATLAHERAEIRRTIEAFERGDDLGRPIRALKRCLGRGEPWTKQQIIDKLQDWAELYGEAPSAMEWNPSQAKTMGRPDLVAQYVAGEWPSAASVQKHFGSWSQGIIAAGFEPMAQGDGHKRRMRERTNQDARSWPVWKGWEMASHLRKRMGLTQADVAERAELSPAWVNGMETGRVDNVQIRPLMAYARVVGVSVAALIDPDGEG